MSAEDGRITTFLHNIRETGISQSELQIVVVSIEQDKFTERDFRDQSALYSAVGELLNYSSTTAPLVEMLWLYTRINIPTAEILINLLAFPQRTTSRKKSKTTFLPLSQQPRPTVSAEE